MSLISNHLRSSPIGRRRVVKAVLAGAGAILAAPALAATRDDKAREQSAAHFPFGPVLPLRALPALPLLTHLGQATDLATLLRGRLTALQLMFTGCSATCPIEGALFAQAQQALPGVWPRSRPAVQWLSLSIDPLADGPVQLAAWLQKFGALPGWVAASPRVGDVERLFAALGGSGEPRPRGPDPHTGQVYILNRQGELAFRTASLPAPATICEALRGVDAERPGG